jgi:sigma-B regulation protein RsbU (phosphoserine phosphatase)
MKRSELLSQISDLRARDLDPAAVDAFLSQLESSPHDEELEAVVASHYDHLNEIVEGLAAAVEEFQGLGNASTTRRHAEMKAARRRFAIQLSALLAANDEALPLDTMAGQEASTSVNLFRKNLRAVASRMGDLVEQTIRDSGLRKELELAGAVQAMLVSASDGAKYGPLRTHSWYQPADQCAGDLWSVSGLKGDDVLMLLGDATGHGAPAALVAAVVKGASDLARLGMRATLQPFQLLNMLNRVLSDSVHGEYLMTCVAARYHAEQSMLTLANAGHRTPWLVREGQIIALSGAGDPPLGVRSVYRYDRSSVEVQAGDMLVLYTDGIPESESPSDEEFGERRLRETVLAHAAQGGGAVVTAVREAVDAFTEGAKPTDDLTLVCVDVLDA